MNTRATTTRRVKRNALRGLFAALLVALPLAGVVKAQSFSVAPVVFAPSGSNTGLSQRVTITLTAPTAIRSLAIPLPLAAQPEFFLVDDSGCAEDGTTVNPAGSICSVLVRFRPALAGLRTATLVITDGAGRATAVLISGVGYYPQISIIPSAMKVVAGLGPTHAGAAGDGDAAILASLHSPRGVAADSFGNVYVADTGNNVIRMLDASGNISTVAGGGAVAGSAADGGLATAASLASPTWLAVDAAGNLYVAESGSHVVRRVAMSTTHAISTVAGSYAAGFSGDGAVATAAGLDTPTGLAVDTSGNLYVADSGNYRVRRVDAVTGNISTFAGTGTPGFNASATPAANAQFSTLSALAIDTAGNIFVADSGNHAVREIIGGNVLVVAGTGAAGSAGDGGAATSAMLASPAGLAISPAGDIFISDQILNTVRKVQASDGVIETVAGSGSASPVFAAGVMPSTGTQLNAPLGIAFDSLGNLLLADSANQVVRALVPSPAEMNFAALPPGSESAPQSLRIENIGNMPLTLVSTAAANSTTSSNFAVVGGTSDACGTTVASGAHCSYNVTFMPQASGAVRGELDVTYGSNNPNFNSIAPVYLTGGAVTALVINPSTLGPIPVNTAASLPITAMGGTGAVMLDLEGTLPPGITSTVSGATLTLSGTPTLAGSYAFTVFASDSLGATATQSYTLQVKPDVVTLSIVETIHTVDSPQILLSLTLAVNESIHVSDVPTPLPSAQLTVNEIVHVTDTPAPTRSLLLTITEAIHVTDSNSALLPKILTVTETIHVSDVSSNIPSASLSVTETVHVTDSPLSLPAARLTVTENISVTDTPRTLVSLSLTITEAIHITDAGTSLPAKLFPISEALHVSDVVNLTLSPLSQTITAPSTTTHTYGDAAFTVSATASSGLPVSVAVQSGNASISGNTVSLNGAGSVTLTFTQGGNSTYSAATPVSVTFNVLPAAAVVTADNVTRAYATANPALTFHVSGLVHGDSAALLSGSPALSTTATQNSAAGTYPISIAQGTLTSPNYTFTFMPGTLTVTGGAAQSISFTQPPNVPLAVGSITLTARSSSGLKVAYTVSGPATLSGNRLQLNAAGTVSVTASQTGDASYAAAPAVTRTFQVTP